MALSGEDRIQRETAEILRDEGERTEDQRRHRNSEAEVASVLADTATAAVSPQPLVTPAPESPGLPERVSQLEALVEALTSRMAVLEKKAGVAKTGSRGLNLPRLSSTTPVIPACYTRDEKPLELMGDTDTPPASNPQDTVTERFNATLGSPVTIAKIEKAEAIAAQLKGQKLTLSIKKRDDGKYEITSTPPVTLSRSTMLPLMGFKSDEAKLAAYEANNTKIVVDAATMEAVCSRPLPAKNGHSLG